MAGEKTMLRYEYGYVYCDGQLVDIDYDGEITIGGYGMIHSSTKAEIVEMYLDKFWTLKLKKDYVLLVTREHGYLVKGKKIVKPMDIKDLPKYYTEEEGELPEL